MAQHALAPVLHEAEAHRAREYGERVHRGARGLHDGRIDLDQHAEGQRVEQKTDKCHEETGAHAEKTAGHRGHEAEHHERGLSGEGVQGDERDGVGLDDDQGEQQPQTARQDRPKDSPTRRAGHRGHVHSHRARR